MNRILVKAAIVGALGGLLFGFDTAVIAGATQQLSSIFNLQPYALGLTVFIGLVGAVIGSMSSGILGQKIGGRKALHIMAILYAVSAVGCALAWSWSTLVCARFIGGVGVGGSSVLGPVYIAEIAPPKWRGRMVGLFQVNVVVGILLAYLSNYVITTHILGPMRWRLELGVAVIPSCLFFAMLYRIPQSARWLIANHRLDEARGVLERLGSADPEAEMRGIMESVHLERDTQIEPVFSRRYTLPIFLAISIGMFNQLTGINAILYYANYIFAVAGFNSSSAALQTVGIGLVNLVATLLGLSVIDKFGRKSLLLVGAIGMAVAQAGVAVIFFTKTYQDLLIWLLALFSIFFSISQGSVIWVYLAEVFPSKVRAKGQSVGCSAHWVVNALIAGAFPYFVSLSQVVPFAFFAAMMFLQFVIVLFIYPETKGRSLEAIQAELGIH